MVGADRPGDTATHLDTAADPDVAPLDDLVDSIDAQPIASVTLALLLRGAARQSIGNGLVAESAAYSVLQAGPEFGALVAQSDVPPATSGPRAAGAHEPRGRPSHHHAQPPARAQRARPRHADAWLDALTIPAADPTVATVDIRGNGPVFCSGGDLDEFGSFENPASAHLVRTATSIGRAIDRVRDRTTVHLHGHCAGSGLELAAFAGRVAAAPDTLLSLPELALGLVPGAGGTVSLTRRAGRHRVALLALSGAVIDADRAALWGLVDTITPSRRVPPIRPAADRVASTAPARSP